MKQLLAILLFFSLPFTAFAAISFDANLPASVTTGTSQTISFTTSGSNRYLVVGVLVQGSKSVTGCTYAGVSMSSLVTQSASDVSLGETDYIFGLANPASGANNIICTYSGSATNAITADDYNGAQQTTAVEVSNSSQNTTGTASVSVTTITDNDWLVGFARGSGVTTASTNTTIRGAQSNINMMDSNAVQTPPGSFSLNFSQSPNTQGWANLVIALKPAATVVTTPSAFQQIFGWW